MDQKIDFIDSLADEFFVRIKNKTVDYSDDPIAKILEKSAPGKKLLEIGCGTGDRLDFLRQKLSLERSVGLEPSRLAVENAKQVYKDVEFYQGTADDLSNIDGEFDIVVLAFVYTCVTELIFLK